MTLTEGYHVPDEPERPVFTMAFSRHSGDEFDPRQSDPKVELICLP